MALASLQKNCNSGSTGKHLPKKGQALSDQLGANIRQAGHIPARARKAGCQPILDRIAHGHRDNGDRCGGLPYNAGGTRRPHDDHIDVECYQLAREIGELLELPACRSVLDEDSLAVDVAAVPDSLLEGVD